MKLLPQILVLATAFLFGCEKAAVEPAEEKLFLHWFTLGQKEELVSLRSAEIEMGEEIDSDGLTGRVIRDWKGIHATLRGHHGLSTGDFRNYVEPEEIFGPAAYHYSGVIHTTYFVVSANPEVEPFYDRLIERRNTPFVLDSDSFEIDLNLTLFADPEPEP